MLRVLDVPTMLKRAKLSRSHFFLLLKEGRGPRSFKIGRRRVATEQDFEAWIEALRRGTDAPAPARNHANDGEQRVAA